LPWPFKKGFARRDDVGCIAGIKVSIGSGVLISWRGRAGNTEGEDKDGEEYAWDSDNYGDIMEYEAEDGEEDQEDQD